MDDVWANAWSQTNDDSIDVKPTAPSPWQPSSSTTKHEEADIGLPSWSAGDVQWTEPTGEASLWSTSVSASDGLKVEEQSWAANEHSYGKAYSGDETHTYAAENDLPASGLSTPKTPLEPLEEEERESGSETTPIEAAVPGVKVSLGTLDKRKSTEETLSTPTETKSGEETERQDLSLATLPATESFDSDLAWSTPVAASFGDISGEDAWGAAWSTDKASDTSVEEEVKDEWTIAQEAKLRRDRSVPPELIASIYEHLNIMSEDLFPKIPDDQNTEESGNWRSGLASVEGLDDIMQRYTQDLGPQPPIQFKKCAVAKAMVNSVRLTRNLPVARNGPLAHLFMTKSLTAWELSVKNRVNVAKDDMPVGWRIEPEAKTEEKPALVEKKSSGLLSFFSRRASGVPPSVDTSSRRSSSVSREASSTSSVKVGTESSRTSVESSVKSPATSIPQSATPEQKQKISFDPPATLPQSSNDLASGAQAQIQSQDVSASSQPAPSAVSRFFNRFSRTRSDVRSGSSSPRSSIALSTNDLEFLSDIVPSHVDGADEDDQLAALSALVSSPPISMKTQAPLPPPLAPPPLPPPPRTTMSRPQSRSSLSRPLNSPVQSQGAGPSRLLADLSDFGAAPSTNTQVPVLPAPLPAPLAPAPIISLKPLLPNNALSESQYDSPIAETVTMVPKLASPPPGPAKLDGASVLVEKSMTPSIPRATPVSIATPILTALQGGQSSSLLNSPDPPEPIEKSPNRVFPQPSTNDLFGDDDDFSDFQSPVTTSSLSQPFTRSRQERVTVLADLSYEAPSDQSFLHGQTSGGEDDLFGDFGDFVAPSVPLSQPVTHTPPVVKPDPPPTTLSRSNSKAKPPPLPKKHVPSEIKTSHIRKPSTAEREAATQLVERAAAHKGRWPAPLTPLPSPLPAPPSSEPSIIDKPMSNHSLLDTDDHIDLTTISAPTSATAAAVASKLKPISQITTAMRSGGTSPAPVIPPPSVTTVQANTHIPSLLDMDSPFQASGFPQFSQQSTSKGLDTVPSSRKPQAVNPTQKGGLSAQDLSFFEGL